MPIDTRVAHQHRILELGRADEPGRARVIEQRRLAPPAVRVRMLVQIRFPEHSALLELLENYGIRILDEHASDQRHVGWKLAAQIDGLQEREAVTLASGVVVRTECR